MKVMGDCLSCCGRTADASEKAEPNPSVLAKTERERDGTRPGSQYSRRQPHKVNPPNPAEPCKGTHNTQCHPPIQLNHVKIPTIHSVTPPWG